MARRPHFRATRYSLLAIVLLLAGLSALQWRDEGRLRWPGELRQAAGQLLDRVPQQGLERSLQDVLQTGQELLSQAAARVNEELGAVPGNTPATGAPTPATGASTALLQGLAINVTDGDTFTLRYSSLEEERVRLHGIDAPERDQPHGRAAGAALRDLIEGQGVQVELVDRDSYGRLVARVWRGDIDVNLTLVQQGHAWWYEYYAQDRRDLELAEEVARNAGLGLWADPTAVAPWDWRRGRR